MALAGAIVLGSLVGAAIPTRMKAPIGPDWRERYGIAFDPSAPSFYVEPAPQDLTPVSDPYFVDAHDARTAALDAIPAYAEVSYRPSYSQDTTFSDPAADSGAPYEDFTESDRLHRDSIALADETPGMVPAVTVTRGGASSLASMPISDAQAPSRTATSRIDAAATAAQQVAQAVNRAQTGTTIATAIH